MEFQPQSTLIDSFEKVYIDQVSINSEVAKRCISLFPKDKVEIVVNEPYSNLKRTLTAEEFDQSKRILFVTEFKGQFFKRCPGSSQSKAINCCNYHVLNLGSQCNMNCSYCYLQSYLNSGVSKIYSNIDQALVELDMMAAQNAHHPFRVGTGEIIDSLSLDHITLFSRTLIPFFKKYPKWTLEFKTKSDHVDQFLDLGPSKQTVVSWSLNCKEIIESEEHKTARLEQRLTAAEKCVKAGFSIAFHLDPLIWHPEWKKNYSALVSEIITRFTPEQVNVISMGTLRFQPEQRHMMKQRFGLQSFVTSAEMFPSEGSKLRYDASLRHQMLRSLYNQFKNHNSQWRIFLCMETPETWVSALDSQPMKKDELKELFRPLPKV